MLRLKKLPTIQDYLNNSVRSKIVTKKERVAKHKSIYKKEPLLEIKNVEKEYFNKAGLFKKSDTI